VPTTVGGFCIDTARPVRLDWSAVRCGWTSFRLLARGKLGDVGMRVVATVERSAATRHDMIAIPGDADWRVIPSGRAISIYSTIIRSLQLGGPPCGIQRASFSFPRQRAFSACPRWLPTFRTE
jgi:hypothetical protein